MMDTNEAYPEKPHDEHEGMTTEEIIAAESHVSGIKRAVDVLSQWLRSADAGVSGFEAEDVQVWLAHIIQADGECGCTFENSYGDGTEVEWCTWFSDPKNRRELYIDWHETSEEALQEKERTAAKEKAHLAAKHEAERREYERQELHRLAAKFNVDPRLLPGEPPSPAASSPSEFGL